MQQLSIIEEIYIYLSLVIMLSVSSSNLSSSSAISTDTSGKFPACNEILLSFSRSFTAKKRFCDSGTLLSSFSSTLCIIFSASSENLCTIGIFPFPASATAFSATSMTPLPFSAEISITSHPSFSPSLPVCILSPDFSSRSAIFTAIITGIPSSSICVDKYRFLSIFVPSTILIITSGLSFVK